LPLVTSPRESSRRTTDDALAADDRRTGLRSSLINVAAAMAVTVATVFILKELESVLKPLFIALFLFYVADPAVEFLTRRKIPYSVAFVLVMSGFIALAVIGIIGLSDRVGEFARRLPELQERVKDLAVSKAGTVNTPPVLRTHIRTLVADHLDFLKPLTTGAMTVIAHLPIVLWDAFLVSIYMAFLIQERRSLPHRLRSVYGAERAARMEAVSERINQSIARYIYIKMLASLFKGILAFGLMSLLRVDFAVVWAALIFAANFIPYVGSILSFALPTAMAVLQFPELWKVFALAAGFFAIDFVIGNYWEPKVSGQRLNVSPVIVVLSLAFWGWLWGVVGMLLSVPITVSIRFILDNIPYTRPLAAVLSYGDPAPRRPS
jgi:predicted PurR-regulated permease PerM